MSDHTNTPQRVSVEVVHVEVPLRLMADAWAAAALRGLGPEERREVAMDAFMAACDAPVDVGLFAIPNVRAAVLAEYGETVAGPELEGDDFARFLAGPDDDEDDPDGEEECGLLPDVPDLFDGSLRC